VEPDVFFDFLGDLEKSGIEKGTLRWGWRRIVPAGRSCVNPTTGSAI
jgi:hypothetical protein